MILYRIRRKDTGQFFCGLLYPWSEKWGKEGWTPKGNFYRDIDTIECWLKILCYNWRANRHRFPSHTWSAKRMSSVINEFDREKLSLYEVVVTNVEINGSKIIKAEDLVK